MQVKVEGGLYNAFNIMIMLAKAMIWNFPTMITMAKQCYETLGIDPLIGNNLKVYVAASSPCIGQYKLTCLQNDSVFLSPAGFERCTVQTLVVFAGRFCLEIAWCVTRLRCAPAWAVLGYFFVGCVALLPCGLYYLAPSWLYCVAPSCLYYVAPSWLYGVAPSWAVLILCRLCCIVTLWALSKAVRFSR